MHAEKEGRYWEHTKAFTKRPSSCFSERGAAVLLLTAAPLPLSASLLPVHSLKALGDRPEWKGDRLSLVKYRSSSSFRAREPGKQEVELFKSRAAESKNDECTQRGNGHTDATHTLSASNLLCVFLESGVESLLLMAAPLPSLPVSFPS